MLCTVPSDPVQNVAISNVTDGEEITISIEWDPPTDPNGVIRYYRVQYVQALDPLDMGHSAVKRRNILFNATVINEFVNITNGSAGAPTNTTLSGLG